MKRRRPGFTLLELIVTTSLLGITLTSIAFLLRSSVTSWEACESDHSRIDEAHGMVRHFIRGFRQADAITAITAANNTTGSITIRNVDGQTVNWFRQGNEILYTAGVSTNNQLVLNVTELSFTGYLADGVTPTTDLQQMRSVRITVKFALNRDANNVKTIRCNAWLRKKVAA